MKQPTDRRPQLCEKLVAHKTIQKVGRDYPGELALSVANANNIRAHTLAVLPGSWEFSDRPSKNSARSRASAFEERDVAAFGAEMWQAPSGASSPGKLPRQPTSEPEQTRTKRQTLARTARSKRKGRDHRRGDGLHRS